MNNIASVGSILVVDDVVEDNVILASRNNPRVFTIDVNSLNAWDIVRCDTILISENGFEKLLKRINPQE